MVEPDVIWAVYPWDDGKVLYSEKLCDSLCDSSCTPLNVGDLITRPCLINPETRAPIPVRVVEIRECPEISPQSLVFVVAPANVIN